MHRSSIDDWLRFYDEVISAGSGWEADAWYAAVGEAMARALPADSPILDNLRRRVDELLQLQRAATGSPHDERRMSALEGEIQRLIGAADEIIRTPRSVPATTQSIKDILGGPRRIRPRRNLLRVAGPTAAALLLVGTGLFGALHLYDTRLALRVDREVERSIGGLRTSVAGLEQKVAAFDQAARAPVERAAGEVSEILGDIKERAGQLRVNVDATSGDVAVLEKSVPKVGERLTRLSGEVDQGEAALGEAMDRIAAVERLAPALEQIAATAQEKIETTTERSQTSLGELEAMLDEIKAAYSTAQQELAGTRIAVDHEISRTEEDRSAMHEVVGDLRESLVSLKTLQQEVERELTDTRQGVSERADAVLDGLTRQAEEAAKRGEEVLLRAEKQLVQDLKAEHRDALAAYADEREQELSELAGDVAATRSELDQTRVSLIESWQRMDQEAASRQKALLADLDSYAAEVEARVEELIAAIDVVAAADEPTAR